MLSLCLFQHDTTKAYGGVEVYLHKFLDSALCRGECSASHHSCFNPRETTSSTHGHKALWAPQPVWMLWRSKKICCSSQESNTDSAVVQPVVFLGEIHIFKTFLCWNDKIGMWFNVMDGVILIFAWHYIICEACIKAHQCTDIAGK